MLVFYTALLIASTMISVVSQIILKKAALRTYPTKVKEYLNAYVIGAYALFFAAALMTVYSYKGVEISTGALIETSAYIFIVVFDFLVFHEKITARKAAATLLIVTGILIILL